LVKSSLSRYFQPTSHILVVFTQKLHQRPQGIYFNLSTSYQPAKHDCGLIESYSQ